MLQSKAFVKKTRKGKVLKVVREHYLRDDIWSGSPLDAECDQDAVKLSASAAHYLIVDTNIVLQQMDFLEHQAVKDVIIMSVVLEEVKHRNQSIYQRLRTLCASDTKRFFVFANENHRDTYIKQEPGESPNDRNDRAIRVGTAWYAHRLPQMKIYLLTNDADNRRKALSEHLDAMSVQAYAKLRTDTPELLDLVAQFAGQNLTDDPMAVDGSSTAPAANPGGQKGSKRKRVYDEHRPMSDIQNGIKSGTYHQGALRVSRFNPFEGWVGSESVGQDILISGRVDMNRALDGDVVAVELLPESQWKGERSSLPQADAESTNGGDEEDGDDPEGGHIAPQVAPGEHLEDGVLPISTTSGTARPTGKVVGVIKRNWRTRGYCGSLQPQEERGGRGAQGVLFCPVERRFPKIRLQTRQAATLMDKRMVVVIDSWQADSMYPAGHYVRTLGTIGDKETETEVLLIENDINTSPFSPAVHACVPPLPWSVTQADLDDPRREDLRHLPICSVDPPGCKDIDDALHVRELPNGNLELGVHIADVTNFLLPVTAMDDEASVRATTCYLVQRRIDMLPKPLTEDICSLRSNVERLAFSAIWEMTQDAQLLSVRGALTLASPEVKFEIDTETHDPLDVGMYQVREANQMVEEMMLLANITVAEHILKHFPAQALLRRHPVPPPRQFDPLLKAAVAAGVSINPETSQTLAASLDEAVRADDSYFNKLIRIMATRCMTQAVYFGSGEVEPPDYLHYGLAAPLYTHFTSPIRRYADVLVHRLLAASLGLAPLPESARDRAGVHALTDNLNTRHRNAQMAGRASVELHTLIFFNNRTIVADARITRVRANGLIIFVPKYGIEGPVYLTSKDASKGHDRHSSHMQASTTGSSGSTADSAQDEFTLDEDKQMVTSKDGQRSYTVFDKAAVKISVEETFGHRRHLKLLLVDRSELPVTEQMS
ncbi:hypothetical protein ABBQ38_012969 [Trebouxia sp. C0009 RCD-2024]